MKGFFRKLFNIYPGEETSAFLFGLLGFLWAFGVTCGLKFADALFLLHVGADSLPTAYICTSCGLIVFAAIFLYIFDFISIDKIFSLVLCGGIAFYIFIGFCLSSSIVEGTTWIYFALRIFGTLFFAIVVTCFWTFIDHYHHLQDAKRLYSLFSSTVFVGIACTGLVMHSGLVTFQHVIFIIVSVLMLAIVVINQIVKRLTLIQDENEKVGVPNQNDTSWRMQIRSVLTSRFTLLLMLGNFLTYVMLVLTEYNYMSSFETAFASNVTITGTGEEQNEALTQFLGSWIAIVSVVNLIVGLFIYSRLVRRFGIGSLVACTPIILLVTFGGWSLSNSLVFPVMGLFVVEGTLYVIDDSNFNLLLSAVPIKLKYKIRLIIESFFEPIGMLVSSLLLSIPFIDSKILGLILAGCFLTTVLFMKAQYLKGIYRNLAEHAVHFHRSVSDWISHLSAKEVQTAEKKLLDSLRQCNSSVFPVALEGLLALNTAGLVNRILQQVDEMGVDAKIECVKTLLKCTPMHDRKVIEHLHSWVDEDSRLKGIISFYLATHGSFDRSETDAALSSNNLVIKGAAVVSLRKHLQHDLARQHLKSLLNTNDEEQLCLGLTILSMDALPAQDVEMIFPFLKHPSLLVARTAAASLAQISTLQQSHFANPLLELIIASPDSEFRLNAIKAIGKMKCMSVVKEIVIAATHFRPSERREVEEALAGLGEPLVPNLLSMTKDPLLDDRSRVLSGRILGRLALPELRKHLYDIISIDIQRASFYFYYHHTVQKQHPELDLQLLSDTLLSGHHSIIDFIIQLLGVAGELEDSELLSRSIRSPHPKVRSQVLETLERACELKIFRLIEPVLSDLPTQQKLHTFFTKVDRLLTLDELLDHLAHSPAYSDQIVAATLKCRLNRPGWKQWLQKHMASKKGSFHHFAYELLKT